RGRTSISRLTRDAESDAEHHQMKRKREKGRLVRVLRKHPRDERSKPKPRRKSDRRAPWTRRNRVLRQLDQPRGPRAHHAARAQAVQEPPHEQERKARPRRAEERTGAKRRQRRWQHHRTPPVAVGYRPREQQAGREAERVRREEHCGRGGVESQPLPIHLEQRREVIGAPPDGEKKPCNAPPS